MKRLSKRVKKYPLKKDIIYIPLLEIEKFYYENNILPFLFHDPLDYKTLEYNS